MLLAEEGVLLDEGVTVTGGDVVVRRASAGPFLSAVEAEFVAGDGVVVSGPGGVVANRADLAPGATVNDLVTNTSSPGGTVLGELTSELAVPVAVAYPEPGVVEPGIVDVVIDPGAWVEIEEGWFGQLLTPGVYGALSVPTGVTVVLTGGRYVFSEVTLAEGGAVVAEGAASVAIATRLEMGGGSYLGVPHWDTPPHLEVTVAGVDESPHPPDGTAVHVGPWASIQARLLAPSGAIALGEGTWMQGSVVGRWVSVGPSSSLSFEALAMPPTVSAVDPPVGATVSGEALLAVDGGASQVSIVEFIVDGVTVGVAEEAPFEFSWDTTGHDEGIHEWWVVATNDHGQVTESPPREVNVRHGLDAAARLEVDQAAGTVTADDAARFALHRYLAPDKTPATYRFPALDGADLTVPVLMELAHLDGADAALREEIVAEAFPVGLPTRGPTRVYGTAEVDEILWRWLSGEGEDLAEPLALGVVDCPPYTGGVAEGPVLRCGYYTELVDFFYGRQQDTYTDAIDDSRDDLDSLLRGVAAGGGPNGIPDPLDEAAQAYMQAFNTYRDLGFEPPGRLRVAIREMGSAGISLPYLEPIDWFMTGPSVDIQIDRDALVYLIRHELFHQFQYQYGAGSQVLLDYAGAGSTTAWWLEATAEWAAHQAEITAAGTAASSVAFTSAGGRYFRKIRDFVSHPSDPLTTFKTPGLSPYQPQYGAFLFAEFLEERVHPDVIRRTWEEIDSGSRAVDAIQAVLAEDYGRDLADLVLAFHSANYSIASPHSVWSSYRDPHRVLWVEEIGGTGRPPAVALTLEAGQMPYQGEVDLGPGGAHYVELAMGQAVDGQIATIEVEPAIAGQGVIVTQLRRFSTYPKHCPWWEDAARRPDDGSGKVTYEIALFDESPSATLIISHAHPERVSALPGMSHIAAYYTISVRDASTGTVVEDHQRAGWHHRANTGEDLDRRLYPAHERARIEIDLGDGFVDERSATSVCLYSIDYLPRDEDVLWVNGVAYTVDHRRSMVQAGGRYGIGSPTKRWGRLDLSCFSPPSDAFTDGVNMFELELRGTLEIRAAYVISHPGSYP